MITAAASFKLQAKNGFGVFLVARSL